MIRARFYTENGTFSGFSIAGHAGYSEKGSDIVCAGVSAMTSLAVTALQESQTVFTFQKDQNGPRARLAIHKNNEFAQIILSSLSLELTALSREYPKHITVSKRRRANDTQKGVSDSHA